MNDQQRISFKEHPGQLEAWYCKKRFVWFCAGVQSGKTTFGAVWILNEADKRGKGQYLIVAPTYKILNQSTLQKFKELVPKNWGIFNKSDSTFTTKDGKTFFLRSADKPESLEGITAEAVWADEASLMKAGAWLIMQNRVSKTQGRILCTFTPISLNWIHKELEADKERGRKGEGRDIDFVQFRSIDSPFFPEKEYERAKRMLTPIQFQLRYEGIFGKAEGLIYPDFDNKIHVVDDFEIPKDWPRIGGMDWGFNNPFVALDAALNPDDVLYVYKERYTNRCLLKDHVPHLDKAVTYYADPSGLQERKELREFDLDIVPGNNDVPLRWQKINARIRTNRLKVFKSCIHTIDEFALYRFRQGQDKEILREEPEKRDDHCMDGMGYMVIGLDGTGPMEFVVLGKDEGIGKSLGGDDWEQKLIEHKQRGVDDEEPEEKGDDEKAIDVLRTPENAALYIRLSSERMGMAEIARQMKTTEPLLRRWITRDREWISSVGRGGKPGGSGIEVI